MNGPCAGTPLPKTGVAGHFKRAHVWEAKMRTDGSNIIDIKFL